MRERVSHKFNVSGKELVPIIYSFQMFLGRSVQGKRSLGGWPRWVWLDVLRASRQVSAEAHAAGTLRTTPRPAPLTNE